MIRRPPRSTPLYSSAASDVYKRQIMGGHETGGWSKTGAGACAPRLRPKTATAGPMILYVTTTSNPTWNFAKFYVLGKVPGLYNRPEGTEQLTVQRTCKVVFFGQDFVKFPQT